jgi:hypothetical protein
MPITDDNLKMAQEAIERMGRMINRYAKTMSVFSGQPVEDVRKELESSLLLRVAEGYDPSRGASWETYVVFCLKAEATKAKRQAMRERRLVDWPEDDESAGFLCEYNDPDDYDLDSWLENLPEDTITALIDGFERERNSLTTLAMAKRLAFTILGLGQTENR